MGRIKLKPTAGSSGYTVVETMIVLAVTGVMFTGVVLLINGRQRTTQFQTAVNDISTRLQSVANEVATGYFPKTNNYSCRADGGSVWIDAGAPATSDGECIFVGKAVHFNESSAEFWTYTMAGVNATTYDSSDPYRTAQPFVIAPSTTYVANNTTGVDVTDSGRLQHGLQPASLKVNLADGTQRNVGSFAFVQSLNNSGVAVSGGASQFINVIAFTATDSNITQSKAAEADSINLAFRSGSGGGGNYVLNRPIELCLNSGTTDKHVIVTIGSETSYMNIGTRIGNGSCGA